MDEITFREVEKNQKLKPSVKQVEMMDARGHKEWVDGSFVRHLIVDGLRDAYGDDFVGHFLVDDCLESETRPSNRSGKFTD